MFVSGWRRCGSEFDDKQEQSATQAARERSCSPRQKHNGRKESGEESNKDKRRLVENQFAYLDWMCNEIVYYTYI